MNDDHDWNEMRNLWQQREADPPPDASRPARKASQAARRYAWRAWILILAVGSTIAVVAFLCRLMHSLLGYAFAIIAWSAILSFGSFLLAAREPAAELAAQTTTALAARFARLARSALFIDFGRTLVGVETLLSLGFWVGMDRQPMDRRLCAAAAIAVAGFLLWGGLTRLLVKTQRQRNSLQSLAAELRGQGSS